MDDPQDDILQPETDFHQYIHHQLTCYFEGNLQQFEIPLNPKGSDFQLKVWEQLQSIPYGQTRSYSDLATRLDDPNAVRAVGNANGQNPIAIVIPCHRVVGTSGDLAGYAGGIDRKRWLLKHEGVLLL